MENPFRVLHHVCIVVHDLERALACYRALGIDGWYDYPKGSAYVEFEVPDADASKAMRYKCADLHNVQLQLCQPPLRDCPQRRFLDAHGEGVYHLGFEVSDLDAAETVVNARGAATTARGRRANGTGFAYFDTREGAGVVLEVRKTES
jgi:catechol 2,3-dioxygenase-like lactoylglutathione lyase family enzyme